MASFTVRRRSVTVSMRRYSSIPHSIRTPVTPGTCSPLLMRSPALCSPRAPRDLALLVNYSSERHNTKLSVACGLLSRMCWFPLPCIQRLHSVSARLSRSALLLLLLLMRLLALCLLSAAVDLALVVKYTQPHALSGAISTGCDHQSSHLQMRSLRLLWRQSARLMCPELSR